MKKFIHQMEPLIGTQEQRAMAGYLASGSWLTEFEKTREFEKMIAKFTGAKYCSVVSNGTVSLAIALMALDIKAGDEVIVPDYTMIASANAVVLAGAKPVLVDIDPNTLCLDLALVKKAVTKKTKAIMLVTINGRSPDMKAFVEFCRQKKIFLVEDAAQSLGSYYGKKHLGTFGDIGSFSFAIHKIVTTGQGGALVTNNKKLYQRILKIKDFGRERSGVDVHQAMGYNFKFTDMQAVIGIEQMKKMTWRITRKKEIFMRYKNLLAGLKEVSLVATDTKQVCPMFVEIMVPAARKKALIDFLRKEGIGTRPFYPPIHTQKPYAFVKGNFTHSQNISRRGIWMPSALSLTDTDITRVCSAVKEFFNS
jgi:perosamine synthetase